MDQSLAYYLFYSPLCNASIPVLNFTMASPMFASSFPTLTKPEDDLKARRYQRIWSKSEIEDVFNTSVQYSQKINKSLEDLTINDFAVIAFGKRQTPEQIMIKVKEVRANGTLRPGKWSQAEDELLVSLIKKNNSSWGHIAQILNSEVHNKLNVRNSKTCKERWNNYLNPEINRGSWTTKEDLIVLNGYLKCGNKWKAITKLIPQRIEGAVKNRVKSILHKLKQTCSTSEDLIKKIQELCNVKEEEISKHL